MLWLIGYIVIGMLLVSWKFKKIARKIIIDKKLEETEARIFMGIAMLFSLVLSFVWPIVLIFYSTGKKKKIA